MSDRLLALTIDLDSTVDFLVRLLNVHSPTGNTTDAIGLCETEFAALGIPDLTMARTRKGSLMLHWRGEGRAQVGITAHVDTLGLMVKEIKPNGCLKVTRIGGIVMSGVETENVTVRTFDGRQYRGTVLMNDPASHVNRDLATQPRNEDTMEVRLDVQTRSALETQALGIEVGDFIFVDPRVEVIDTGFIRSRFLDDKASVACIYGAMAAMHHAGKRPANDTRILISNFEEVGHGGAADWSPDLQEYLSVDMAAIGYGQNSDEFNCTICTKDASGPYSYEMISKLRRLADAHGIPYRTDIYPFYSSDGSAYWRAGGSARVALIGPGVSGSHSYERTHRDALRGSAELIGAYMTTAVESK
ncbi:MAG: M42 family metallopeptidase [Chloroflexota bacterium]|nr:M42 family metallopeptidase [Chloroflexota bacterium]